jgi:predicted Fe-S protein YdhL (DUF1289 family)
MRLQLSFWEARARAETPLVWATLDDEQRAEVVAALARLIMTAATSRRKLAAVLNREEANRHE